MCILLFCVVFCLFNFILFVFSLCLSFSLLLFLFYCIFCTQRVLKLFLPLYSNLIHDSGCIQMLQTAYCPYNRKLMISFVDPNFVVIDQTLFCPIHHQTLSSYSPFVLRLELPPVKAGLDGLLCSAAITHLFFSPRIPTNSTVGISAIYMGER